MVLQPATKERLREHGARAGALAVLLAALTGCPADESSGDALPSARDARREGQPSARDAAPCTARVIERATGKVIDESGQPLRAAQAQMCLRTADDRLLCLRPAATDSTGAFAIEVVEEARCVKSVVMRALVADGDRATVYCPVALGTGGSTTLTIAQPLVLHRTRRATALPPEGDAKKSRVVRFADGVEIDVVPDELYASPPGYAGLAAVRLAPSAKGLCFVDQPQRYTAFYAFSPEADVEGAGFSFRLPNDSGASAGASVDLYLLGGLSCRLADGTFVDEGKWVKFGTATVSSDGKKLLGRTPCLTWLGLRAR